jgi:DNA-binding MarR family transcriptional regulator
MRDRFEGSRPDPFLITPVELLRDKDFIKWHTLAEYGTWAYLYSYIVRAHMGNGSFGTFLFYNYYQKGLLASRWNQKQIAENMGKSRKSSGQISRHTISLEEKGFIEKEYKPWNGKKTLIYILGTRDFTSRKHETIYAFEHFMKSDVQDRLDNLSIKV